MRAWLPGALLVGAALTCSGQDTSSERLALARARAPITALAISPDGEHVISGSQNGLSDPQFSSDLVQIHEMAFSPDGSKLAVAGGEPAESGTVEVFESDFQQNETAKRILRRTDHSDVVYALDWSPDGSLIATAGLDAKCRIIDVAGGDLLRTISGHSRGISAVRFLNQETLATGSLDHTIRIWKVADGSLVRTLSNHSEAVRSLSVRPGQPAVALPVLASVSRDSTVRLWQPTIGRLVRFCRLSSRPLTVTWLPEGSKLVVGCEDGQVRIIDPNTVQVEAVLPGADRWAWSVVCHPNGSELVVGGFGGQVLHVPLGLR